MTIKHIKFVTSKPDVSLCPQSQLPEYAFIGRSNVGEYIYRDNDNNNDVSVGDTRLSNVESTHSADTSVQAGDSDLGDCLHSFAANERFDDWVTANGEYDPNEFIYVDKDNSMTVSVGDQRLTEVRYNTAAGPVTYPPGSIPLTATNCSFVRGFRCARHGTRDRKRRTGSRNRRASLPGT